MDQSQQDAERFTAEVDTLSNNINQLLGSNAEAEAKLVNVVATFLASYPAFKQDPKWGGSGTFDEKNALITLLADISSLFENKEAAVDASVIHRLFAESDLFKGIIISKEDIDFALYRAEAVLSKRFPNGFTNSTFEVAQDVAKHLKLVAAVS